MRKIKRVSKNRQRGQQILREQKAAEEKPRLDSIAKSVGLAVVLQDLQWQGKNQPSWIVYQNGKILIEGANSAQVTAWLQAFRLGYNTKKVEFTWGDESFATLEEAQTGIENYIRNELQNRNLEYVDAKGSPENEGYDVDVKVFLAWRQE